MRMTRKRIAVVSSAEPYGFGPVSKLGALSAEMIRRGHWVDFVGSGTAIEFANRNEERFSSLAALGSRTSFEGLDPGRYDLALSVMDPSLIAWAKACNLPSIYVDSLFWAWEWPSSAAREWSGLADDIALRKDATEAVAAIQQLPMHASQFAAHHIADLSLVQQVPSTGDRSAKRGIPGDVRSVGAIVDLTERAPGIRDSWLVSASGVLNELTPLSEGIAWTNIVLTLLEEAIAEVGTTLPVTLTGHRQVFDHARPARNSRICRTSLSHRSLLQHLNHSVACLAPPGLTTMLEAVCYDTPLILLPAQHYGHTKNIDMMNRGDSTSPPFPGGIFRSSIDGRNGHDVQGRTRAVLHALDHAEQVRGTEWRALVGQLSAALALAESNMDELVRVQRDAVSGIVAGFDGVLEVADAIESSI